ncbi:hypothetical protein D9619_008460 [Psilocybe cf. subviscida]|uniref:Magnesium-dependent phosphatase-1 n=1 Tax=Psilocybe cf. subviscida TaxID=2480587 RepID=A0A8H5BB64_9AGAR|nr:hypothetical protein D9619_008460 [Psilocybe cf. subviscida]
MSSDTLSPGQSRPYPSLIASDLEFVSIFSDLLWSANDICLFIATPFGLYGLILMSQRKGGTLNEVLDKHGDIISLYAEVPDILHGIRARGLRTGDEADNSSKVIIAACSRTHTPKLASDCMKLLLVPPSIEHAIPTPTPMIEFFDETEIYPGTDIAVRNDQAMLTVMSSGSKLNHFKALHQRTGVPYSQMLFFDDEHRNAEVETLGVIFNHCPDGLTADVFNQGLKKWRIKHTGPDIHSVDYEAER